MQFQQLHALRRSGDSSGCRVDSASIAWAFQSDCQDDLLNSVLPAEPTWPEMQKLGIGLWYTNVSQLRTRVCESKRSNASELCNFYNFFFLKRKWISSIKRSGKLEHVFVNWQSPHDAHFCIKFIRIMFSTPEKAVYVFSFLQCILQVLIR